MLKMMVWLPVAWALRGSSFSIVLPLHSSRLREFEATSERMRLWLETSSMDLYLLASPCLFEQATHVMATGRVDQFYNSSAPLSAATTEALVARDGRMDRLWGSGIREMYMDVVPESKWMHMCDDYVICGEMRCGLVGRRQQLVKLGASRIITSAHMLVLDADVFPLAPITARLLLTGDGRSRILSTRAACSIGGNNRRLSEVIGKWSKSYNHSIALLEPASRRSLFDYTVPADACALGVTPQVLSTAVVRRILKHVETANRHEEQAPWWTLLGDSKFTEVALYNTFLLLYWDDVGRGLHEPTGTNITASIWASALRDVPVGADRKRRAAQILDDLLMSRRVRDQPPAAFFVCQRNTGLSVEDCMRLADRVEDDAVQVASLQAHQSWLPSFRPGDVLDEEV